jgi:hypothetical protein
MKKTRELDITADGLFTTARTAGKSKQKKAAAELTALTRKLRCSSRGSASNNASSRR